MTTVIVSPQKKKKQLLFAFACSDCLQVFFGLICIFSTASDKQHGCGHEVERGFTEKDWKKK